jgi:enoyl-CoA hydratase/carnithine racemase
MSHFAKRPHVGRLQIRKRPIPQPAQQKIATNLTIERDGPVTTLIRDPRAARNAMDPASAEALTDALLAFDADERQWVAVLWGAGGAFCAGFDLKYAAGLRDERRRGRASRAAIGRRHVGWQV